MKEYYMLLRLNQKEVKIISVEENNGIIDVSIENKKKKVRCPKCNKFTSSAHGKNKPIKSKYLKACEQRVIGPSENPRLLGVDFYFLMQ